MVKTCSICLEDCRKNNIVVLDCYHNFHINCYTKYIIHEVKDKVDMGNYNVKCPMCRKIDLNMFMPILDTLQEYIEVEADYKMFIDELEDLIVKEFLPHLISVVNGKRFSKRSMCNVLRKVISENEKVIKQILKDLK